MARDDEGPEVRPWKGGLVITSRPLLMLGLLRKRSYGLELIRTIETLTGGGIGRLREGSVYRMLGQLEREGLARSQYGEPLPERGGRRRKYYELTVSGRRQAIALKRELRKVLGPLLDIPADPEPAEEPIVASDPQAKAEVIPIDQAGGAQVG